MSTKIKADTLQALDAWKAGKPVRSIELGHVQRMTHSEEHLKAYPNTRPQIDLTQRVSVDQERAYDYLFAIIEHVANDKGDSLKEHPFFLEMCRALPLHETSGLTDEEKYAVESLAWKALLIGWRRAIDGFPEAHYIEVTNPAVAAK